MKVAKNLPAIAFAVLLGLCAAAYFETRETSNPASAQRPAKGQRAPLVDDRLLRTARAMAALADTPDEQDDAREALHLADHALDQAFETALRQAQASTAPATGKLRQVSDEIAKMRADVAADQKRVDQLTKEAAGSDAATDELDLAKAQLSLDQDELDDALQDRARMGGDRHAEIERALEQHENDQKVAPPMPRISDPSAAATMADQVKEWFSLGDRMSLLEQAREQALNQASSLTAQHDQLEKQSLASRNAAPEGETTAAKLARLHGLSDQRKTLAEFDKRVQDSQQLATVYQAWGNSVSTGRRAVLHRILESVCLILAILLLVAGIDRAISHAFHYADRKRLHQVRVITTVGVQAAAAITILLIIFGQPTQVSTIIGLATAGLTVVMKDFIVAFFGWFTLMGKNGLRVGDWVEIEGVSGEVVDIGILKTVLLEMGNWSNKGHPTGRKVAFSNSFAMEKHFFNFSTSNQLLWDQIEIAVPRDSNPYQMAEQIRDLVERETQEDAAGAAEEWERVASKYSSTSFSSKPSVYLRPASGGFEVVVRYITRAPRRDLVKSRLFHAIVDLLQNRADAAR